MDEIYASGTVKQVILHAVEAELDRLRREDPERAELWQHVVDTLNNLAATNLESAFLVLGEESRGKSIVLLNAEELADFILFREYAKRLAATRQPQPAQASRPDALN